MTWQVASAGLLAVALAGGFAWYERDKPPARVLALVAVLAALAVVGRLAFAAIPNVKPTTDVVLFAGYALGAVPGFVVGAVTAIVSNIFLSQGPWTMWQMAGWGAVGLGGALLAWAMRGREPNRLALAAACGLAGLAFGAWMDVYQWTLAARQDLDSYLAVAATSLPYNLAHAIGNIVFSLLIGPAFVRALRRYRRRLEVSWKKAPVGSGAAAVVLAALALAASASEPAAPDANARPAPASSSGRDAPNAEAGPAAASPSERAVRYLLRAQNRDGGFGGAPGQRSSELLTGWSGLGLAAAGRNPRDVRRPGGRSITAYLRRNAHSLADIGEIERTVLLLEAAGLSPRSFAGRDLVAQIRRRRQGDGSIEGFVSYTAFGVLAVRGGGGSVSASTVRWLLRSQNADGGFGVSRSSASDSDMSGATLQALAVTGRSRSAAARRAVAYLRSNQNGDGGFGQMKGRSSNAQSTAYGVQGLLAVRAARGAVGRGLGYLRGLQRADGSIGYSRSSRQSPVWVTAQALPALRRRPLPIAAVPRAPGVRRSERETRPAAKGNGTSGGRSGDRHDVRPSSTADGREPGGSLGEAPSAGHPTGAGRAGDESGGSAATRVERDARQLARQSETAVPRARTRAGEKEAGGSGASTFLIAGGLLATVGLLVLARRRLLWRPRRHRPARGS
jgi:hypothetical protein